MPDLATLALFAAASAALLVVPGPTIMLVLARSLAQGRAVALPLVLGVGLGDLVAASLALAGAGALLTASATAFLVVKTVGALYLVWMGVRLFLAPVLAPVSSTGSPAANGVEPGANTGVKSGGKTGRAAFRDGFLVTVFNPKGLLFFIAFVPQFIAVDAPYASQAAVFVIVFVLLAVANGAAYALAADRLRRLVRHASVMRWINRLGGGAIALAGVAAFFTRRPAV